MKVFIGYDSREDVAYKVCEFSIRKHTRLPSLAVQPLEHVSLRKQGLFRRPWNVEAETGLKVDGVDGRPFSTDFSHTRFLVPHLCGYKGWALFMDCDMVFTTPIEKLFDLADPKYAAMVVKHKHVPPEQEKMDGQPQARYFRKNWSSFILFNCGHPANQALTPEYVSFHRGREMHAFSWLGDEVESEALIGELPKTYNWIEGSSPPMPPSGKPNVKASPPDVIHYTVGGPWFPNCRAVKYADVWQTCYEKWQFDGNHDDLPTHVPTMKYEKKYQKA